MKGNQPTLHDQITATFPVTPAGSEHYVHEERIKGRIVRRAIWVAPATGIDFPNAKQVFSDPP